MSGTEAPDVRAEMLKGAQSLADATPPGFPP